MTAESSGLVRCIRFTLSVLRCVTLIGIFAYGVWAYVAPDDDIKLEIEVHGSEVTTDVEFFVRATPQETWAVLTDYDHATKFISGLERSVVLTRSGEMLIVSQKGRVDYGPFFTTFETIAETHLIPYESISSRMLSGNMKKNQSTTLISPESGGTRVVHHLESIPDVWIPPIIGRVLIAHEVRNRFRQLIAEILRRHAASTRMPSGHPD